MMPSPKNSIADHYISFEDKDEFLQFLIHQFELDLTDYSEASVRRRITKMIYDFGLKSVEELKFYLANKPNGEKIFLKHFTVSVTEMFRDGVFFKKLIHILKKELSDKKHIRILSAGCSSGEELVSMAILLYEQGLLERCELTGTDISEDIISKAKEGIYELRHINTYIKSYEEAGGRYNLSDYFISIKDKAHFENFIISKINYHTHNLQQPIEGNFDLIICRNVLIYFNSRLQDKIFSHFLKNLNPKGLLALGSKESLIFFDNRNSLDELDPINKIYQKRG